jgi:hypothetical protein
VGTGYTIHNPHSSSVKAGCHRHSHGFAFRQYEIPHDRRTRTLLVLPTQLR